ncbi:hypothetical protein Pfo_016677 [Paulownia fortunei]|nr:hypothetical protein Pfo_016677 [Paulownia fortunei]
MGQRKPRKLTRMPYIATVYSPQCLPYKPRKGCNLRKNQEAGGVENYESCQVRSGNGGWTWHQGVVCLEAKTQVAQIQLQAVLGGSRCNSSNSTTHQLTARKRTFSGGNGNSSNAPANKLTTRKRAITEKSATGSKCTSWGTECTGRGHSLKFLMQGHNSRHLEQLLK